MKTILIETMSVSAAILFWAVVLLVAVVFISAVELWKKLGFLSLPGPLCPIGRLPYGLQSKRTLRPNNCNVTSAGRVVGNNKSRHVVVDLERPPRVL